MPVDDDIFSEPESLVASLSPNLASVSDAESREDAVDLLLREEVAAVALRRASSEERTARDHLRTLPDEAVLAQARVLSGPSTSLFRVKSGSRASAFYELNVDGGDVICTCLGFEYRGSCWYARTLQAELARGRPVPAELEAYGRSGDR